MSPQTLDAPAGEPSATAETQLDPRVVNPALFDTPQRTIIELSNAGLFNNDLNHTQRTAVQLLKRINHAANADGAELPDELRGKLKTLQLNFKTAINVPEEADYKTAVQQGAVNALLDGYLSILVKANEIKIERLEAPVALVGEENKPEALNDMLIAARANLKKYNDERNYYKNNPQPIKDVAEKFPAMVRDDKFLSTSKIVALSGTHGEDVPLITDLANDVQSIQEARWLNVIRKEFPSPEMLEAYAQDPAKNAVRIKAMAERVAHATDSMQSIKEFEPAGGQDGQQLDIIRALHTLVSAQMHYAMMQERSPEKALVMENKARAHIEEATQAALSLAYDYTKVGEANNDSRVITLRKYLNDEMDHLGIKKLSLEDAKMLAAKVAKAAGEDLLGIVGNDANLKGKILKLTEAAGVTGELQPQQHLIGAELTRIIEDQLQQNPDLILPGPQEGLTPLQRILQQRYNPNVLGESNAPGR